MNSLKLNSVIKYALVCRIVDVLENKALFVTDKTCKRRKIETKEARFSQGACGCLHLASVDGTGEMIMEAKGQIEGLPEHVWDVDFEEGEMIIRFKSAREMTKLAKTLWNRHIWNSEHELDHGRVKVRNQ